MHSFNDEGCLYVKIPHSKWLIYGVLILCIKYIIFFYCVWLYKYNLMYRYTRKHIKVTLSFIPGKRLSSVFRFSFSPWNYSMIREVFIQQDTNVILHWAEKFKKDVRSFYSCKKLFQTWSFPVSLDLQNKRIHTKARK